jgi:hypothetical protein
MLLALNRLQAPFGAIQRRPVTDVIAMTRVT